MMLGMMLLWGVVIAPAMSGATSLFPRGRATAGFRDEGPSAQELLDRSYARGEISRKQYELIWDDIERTGRGR